MLTTSTMKLIVGLTQNQLRENAIVDHATPMKLTLNNVNVTSLISESPTLHELLAPTNQKGLGSFISTMFKHRNNIIKYIYSLLYLCMSTILVLYFLFYRYFKH